MVFEINHVGCCLFLVLLARLTERLDDITAFPLDDIVGDREDIHEGVHSAQGHHQLELDVSQIGSVLEGRDILGVLQQPREGDEVDRLSDLRTGEINVSPHSTILNVRSCVHNDTSIGKEAHRSDGLHHRHGTTTGEDGGCAVALHAVDSKVEVDGVVAHVEHEELRVKTKVVELDAVRSLSGGNAVSDLRFQIENLVEISLISLVGGQMLVLLRHRQVDQLLEENGRGNLGLSGERGTGGGEASSNHTAVGHLSQGSVHEREVKLGREGLGGDGVVLETAKVQPIQRDVDNSLSAHESFTLGLRASSTRGERGKAHGVVRLAVDVVVHQAAVSLHGLTGVLLKDFGRVGETAVLQHGCSEVIRVGRAVGGSNHSGGDSHFGPCTVNLSSALTQAEADLLAPVGLVSHGGGRVGVVNGKDVGGVIAAVGPDGLLGSKEGTQVTILSVEKNGDISSRHI